MKKSAVTCLTLIFFIYSFSLGQSEEAHQAYIKATTAQSLAQKIQLLKDYLSKYKGKGTQYENYANAHLCFYCSQSKSLNEAAEYGETSLALGGFDDLTKCQVYLTLSTIYTKQGKNLEKAKNHSKQVVELAQVNQNKSTSLTTTNQWKKLTGAGYYTLAQAQERAKQLKGAVSSYIKSYNILKNPQIGHDLKKTGKSLYDFKFYKNAEEAFRAASAILKDYESYSFYAKTLYKNRKKEQALSYFKKAYAKKKSGEIAYNIGIILAGKAKKDHSVSEEAIKYLIEASFLSRSNSKKARALAESLFFNSKGSSEYNEIIKEISTIHERLEELIEIYNENIEGKNQEDLTDTQKKANKALLVDIEVEKAKLQKLESKQKLIVCKFNELLEDTKKRLGIK